MQGPQEYCNSLNSSLNYISANDLKEHLASTQILGDQQQSGNNFNLSEDFAHIVRVLGSYGLLVIRYIFFFLVPENRAFHYILYVC